MSYNSLLKEQNKLFNCLKYYSQINSLNLLEKVSNKTKSFISESRFNRFQETINKRNKRFVIVCENLGNAGNFSACVRTADGFGIQNLYLITDREHMEFNTGEVEEEVSDFDSNFEKYDRISTGSDKWLTINKFKSTIDCINHLKKEGYSIWVSDLSATSFQFDQLIFQPNKITTQLNYFLKKSINNLNNLNNLNNQNNNQEENELKSNLVINDLLYSDNNNNASNNNNFIKNDEKIALIFGNEITGITELMRSMSDRRFYLPMIGLAQSFNVSVSVAMTLSFLNMQGVLNGNLSPLEKQKLLNKYILSSVPNNKLLLNRLGFSHTLISKLINLKI